jgi:nucleotide-binding universal stress UspA family protein
VATGKVVVVGVDETEGSAAAVRFCATASEIVPLDVIAVHALGEDARLPSEAEFEEWCGPLLRAGCEIRRIVEDDRAGHLLERIASNEHADAIVIGASRRGAVAARLLGTVVDELAHHTSIPLVVVPASYGDAPGAPDEPGRGS